MDQNEKLTAYGYSRYIPASACMPVKNNVIIYNDVYRYVGIASFIEYKMNASAENLPSLYKIASCGRCTVLSIEFLFLTHLRMVVIRDCLSDQLRVTVVSFTRAFLCRSQLLIWEQIQSVILIVELSQKRKLHHYLKKDFLIAVCSKSITQKHLASHSVSRYNRTQSYYRSIAWTPINVLQYPRYPKFKLCNKKGFLSNRLSVWDNWAKRHARVSVLPSYMVLCG